MALQGLFRTVVFATAVTAVVAVVVFGVPAVVEIPVLDTVFEWVAGALTTLLFWVLLLSVMALLAWMIFPTPSSR